MKTHRKYRVAAVSFEPVHGEKEQNIARLSELIHEAATNQAKIVVAPEMATIGLFWRNRAHIANLVEQIPGPTTDHFAALAKELDIYIAVGLGEIDPETETYYNAAILAGPEGLIGKHRKVHAYLSDPMWAGDGDLGFQTWDTPIGKLGMMICMDANYPESARLLATNGADVLLLPVNWVDEQCPAPLWITRAFDNGVSAICANRWGSESGFQFSGGSAVLSPDGSIQSYASDSGEDEIVYGEIDLDDPRSQQMSFDPAIKSLEGRRPELYGALTLNRYLWNTERMQLLFGDVPLPQGEQFNLASWELAVGKLDVDNRLARLNRWLQPQQGDSIRLIVLPEFSFTGPPDSVESAQRLAEPLRGISVSRLEAWCKQSGCYLVAGIIEQDRERLFNTLVLIGPEGLVTHYRKTHLSSIDAAWANPGDALVWADTPIGRIGLLTGADMLYPEPARCLAIEGVDIVCVSAALTGPQPIQLSVEDGGRIHWNLFRTRAAENNICVAAANWCGDAGGSSYVGGSGIFIGPFLFSDVPEEEVWPYDWENGDGVAIMSVDTRSNIGSGVENPLRTKPALQRRLPSAYVPLLHRQPRPISSSNSNEG